MATVMLFVQSHSRASVIVEMEVNTEKGHILIVLHVQVDFLSNPNSSVLLILAS